MVIQQIPMRIRTQIQEEEKNRSFMYIQNFNMLVSLQNLGKSQMG